jgi:D-glycero-D-manno-heptose 1,7-bisphosphate phosphatase
LIETSGSGQRFALLDRDGTIIVDKIYLADPEQIEFAPGVVEGLHSLRDAGVRFILITNQSGIARGYFTEDTLAQIHTRLCDLLMREGVRLEGIYHCPHGPEDDCSCRKPKPGLVRAAMSDFGFNPADAVLIGDSAADMGAAAAAEIKGIRIAQAETPDQGYGAAANFQTAAQQALAYFLGRGHQTPTCT